MSLKSTMESNLFKVINKDTRATCFYFDSEQVNVCWEEVQIRKVLITNGSWKKVTKSFVSVTMKDEPK